MCVGCVCTGDRYTRFASSEDYSLLGIIPWALSKELCILQTSWISMGDKTSKYVQEIPRLNKLYQYTYRNLQTIAAGLFCFNFFHNRSVKVEIIYQVTSPPVRCPWKQECGGLRLRCVLVDTMAIVLDGDSSITLKNGPLLSFAKDSH